jgi:hypothetical protein
MLQLTSLGSTTFFPNYFPACLGQHSKIPFMPSSECSVQAKTMDPEMLLSYKIMFIQYATYTHTSIIQDKIHLTLPQMSELPQ